jgi:hypothetical protein
MASGKVVCGTVVARGKKYRHYIELLIPHVNLLRLRARASSVF